MKFDLMLDANDKDFIDNLLKALDIKEGDILNITTPKFARIDGRIISYAPQTLEEYEALKLMTPENLEKVGCQVWEKTQETIHWLYPVEWYGYIPEGLQVVNICGDTEKFRKGFSDDDKRFGALAYGFIQKRKAYYDRHC